MGKGTQGIAEVEQTRDKSQGFGLLSILSGDTKSRDAPQGMMSPGLRVTTPPAKPPPT